MTRNGRDHLSQNQSKFENIAEAYSQGQAKRFDAGLLSAMIAPLRAERVLDVATGTAAAAAAVVAASTGCKFLVGLDPSAEMLRRARASLSMTVLAGAAEELPFADATFNLVTCTRALHHIGQPGLAISELARVVRPGGHVVVADNVTDLTGEARDSIERIQRVRDFAHGSTLSEGQITELLNAHSLELVERHNTVTVRPLTQWLDDGGAGEDEASDVRRQIWGLQNRTSGPLREAFERTFITCGEQVTGLKQKMAWISARRRAAS